MRVAVIGGTGHIGTYLVPRLADAGHAVINVSRGLGKPYQPNPAWSKVEQLSLDRDAEEGSATFGARILEAKPDVVIDLTCYQLESARSLVAALRGRIHHFLHCGTIWVHGHGVEVPTTEEQPRRPISDYGAQKAAIEAYLLGERRNHGFPMTVLHPGHLVGRGWTPLNPAANFNLKVFADLAQGNEIALPNMGRETVHHVHADDVAQGFVQAVANRAGALGESFHVVSEAALTLVGYAESVASWFGRQARICFLPWEEWRRSVTDKEAQVTWDHIARSPNCSIAKARRLLNYQPNYSSLEAIRESISDLINRGTIDTGGAQVQSGKSTSSYSL
jgi:nucleoside-diphosphate-sugar epimerase